MKGGNFMVFSELLTGAKTAMKQRSLGLAQLAMEATNNEDSPYYQDMLELAKRYRQTQENAGGFGLVGAIAADPATWATLPIAGGGLFGMARAGAIGGGGTGYTQPVESKQESRLQNAAFNAAISTGVNTALYGAGKAATSPEARRFYADEFGSLDIEKLLNILSSKAYVDDVVSKVNRNTAQNIKRESNSRNITNFDYNDALNKYGLNTESGDKVIYDPKDIAQYVANHVDDAEDFVIDDPDIIYNLMKKNRIDTQVISPNDVNIEGNIYDLDPNSLDYSEGYYAFYPKSDKIFSEKLKSIATEGRKISSLNDLKYEQSHGNQAIAFNELLARLGVNNYGSGYIFSDTASHYFPIPSEKGDDFIVRFSDHNRLSRDYAAPALSVSTQEGGNIFDAIDWLKNNASSIK